MSRKSHKRQTRRDRRKAKASGFHRLGKNPKRVGHGSSLPTTLDVHAKIRQQAPKSRKSNPSMTPLGEIVDLSVLCRRD